MRFILLICCLFSTSFAYTQTTWYVSTTGSDENSGTAPDQSLATISMAISNAACGDSIVVAQGDYTEKINAYKVCPENQRIVIQGDPDNRPHITGNPLATNRYAISASGAGYRFRHLELTSPFPDECAQSNMIIVGSGDYFDFIDLKVHHSGYDGIKTIADCEQNNYPIGWRIVNCEIINNGLGCPASVLNGDGVDFTSCHACSIEQSTIKNNMGHQLQIKLGARNVTVTGSHLEGTHLLQLGLPGSVLPCDANAINADSIYIHHNTFLAKGDTSEFMIRMADVRNMYIEHNTLVKDSVMTDVGFICFGGCGSSTNWQYSPQSPTVVRNNIFFSMADLPFYAGPDATFLDPLDAVPQNVDFGYNLFYNLHNDYQTPPDNHPNSLIADPLFCDYPLSFTLSNDSPCIDAGDPESGTDPDGTLPDLGAKPWQTPCEIGINDASPPLTSWCYPNPGTGMFYIRPPLNQPLKYIRTYNSYGQLVHTNLGGTGIMKLDLQHLRPALYFVQIESTSGEQWVQPLIIQR